METKETRSSGKAKTSAAGKKSPPAKKPTREEAKQAKLKAESRERAKRRADRKAKEREERSRRIEAGRRRSAERSQRRQVEKKRSAKRPILPDVVYTAPKPFNRSGFLLRLATVVAVVFALTFCISIFFKVEQVNVSGTGIYTPWDVMQASGIKVGDNLLGLAKAKASGRITAGLKYVESVRIGIQLPNTVNIEITESEVLYAIADRVDQWWLITAQGRVVDQAAPEGEGYTKILGVKLDEPVVGEQAKAAELTPLDDVIRDSDRFTLALTIARELERNGIIGGAATIETGNTGDMRLWYGDQYLVKLGDSSNLEYKLASMKSAIDQMEDYRSGVLDISFTTWTDQLAFTPFIEE
jgi:cell division septal protein FtsQ